MFRRGRGLSRYKSWARDGSLASVPVCLSGVCLISKQAVTRKHSRDSKHLPKLLLVNSQHRLSTPHLKCDVSSVICVCQEQLTTMIKLMAMRIDEWRHLAIINENYHVSLYSTANVLLCSVKWSKNGFESTSSQNPNKT